MLGDFWLVVRWWGTLFFVGGAAFPITKRLFEGWFDDGYFFSKAVGMAVVTYLVYLAGTVHVLPFSSATIFVALVAVFFTGVLLKDKEDKKDKRDRLMIFFLEEIFFFVALLFWSWIKAHEPSIHGLEKFMDFGFMKSILNTTYFPAPDMWYAGQGINYYYFGHVVTAVLTKLSGIDLAYTFNLMLATIFAITLTMSFSIGKQLTRGVGGALLTAFLVTLAGNMQTIYAFTKGYVGDNVQPFWKLGWDLGGMKTYWYANATRFIPYTIHEFPGYSFVVSDVHGHVLSLPFVLLAIALLLHFFSKLETRNSKLFFVFYGFLVGVLLMTNALDGPIYFALLGAVLVIQNSKFKIQNLKTIGSVALVAFLTSMPFLVHFKSFVSGVAVNCPPSFLANTKIGPLIFETVEKCQHSPIWMMLLLWGFFLYCGSVLASKRQGVNASEKMLLIFFLFFIALIIFPEFFYFKDIYPMHFRSNTMFKLGYQAFILFSIVSGYAIVSLLQCKVQSAKCKVGKTLFFIFLLPQLFLVSIYPAFAVRSYFGELKKYEGLSGLTWLKKEYPDDWKAIEWLNGQPVYGILVEADGDSYTDYARFSAFTGHPTIVGWAVHEWLWRGSYDVVAPRREEVRKIYEERDVEETKKLLKKYRIFYVVVGALERTKFKNLQEWKFTILGAKAFQSGETVLYAVKTI